MDGLYGKTQLKWMIWGYHYFGNTHIGKHTPTGPETSSSHLKGMIGRRSFPFGKDCFQGPC